MPGVRLGKGDAHTQRRNSSSLTTENMTELDAIVPTDRRLTSSNKGTIMTKSVIRAEISPLRLCVPLDVPDFCTANVRIPEKASCERAPIET